MNRIFSLENEGWPSFPSLSYGRLDQVEQADPNVASETVFSFDVVDASWSEFASGADFDLGDTKRLDSKMRGYWSRMFGPPGARPDPDPYVNMPIYRIEITSRPGDAFFQVLSRFLEDDWVRIELAQLGTFPVDVYGGLFAAQIGAHLVSIASETNYAAALSIAFDMDAWPDASEVEMTAALRGVVSVDYLAAFDIGQGSANGLMDKNETVRMYFDLGCGVYGNARTAPNPLRFCWRGVPPVVLSHWDSDHWSGAIKDPRGQIATWIAPRQPLLPSHTAFASRILTAGGTLFIWGSVPQMMSVATMAGQQIRLARCSGPSSNKNGSGISCVVEFGAAGDAWLLTGDAGYHQLGQPIPSHLRAVVVPHHGAAMVAASMPPFPAPGYARLLYSFGPDNKHGRTKVRHPTPAAMAAHVARGWNHGGWAAGQPGFTLASGDVLATATHLSTHLDGAVVGSWTAPAVPFRSIPCPSPGLCTGKVTQS